MLYSDWGQLSKRKIACIAVTPKNNYLFTLSSDAYLRQWNIEKRRLEKDYGKIYNIFEEEFNQMLCITPDGSYLFTNDNQSFLKQWSIKDQVLYREYNVLFTSPITSMALSHNGLF